MTGRRLHILEVGLTWPPETFVRWKLEGLVARGFDVTVGAILPEPGVRIPGVRVVRLPHWDESTARTFLGVAGRSLELAVRSPRSLAATIAAARDPVRERTAGPVVAAARRMRTLLPVARLRPDVVHFEWNSAAVSYLPLAPVWGCPTVVSCHGTDVNVRPHCSQGEQWTRWLRRSFERVSAVHCVSQALVSEAAVLGMDPARATLIRPAVDPLRFTPEPRAAEGDELRVVSVGQLRWVKGHEYALRAIRRLVDEGIRVRLDLVGDDPAEAVGETSNRARVEHAIRRLDLAGQVRLWGGLESDAVLERLRDADVLLHTSVSEGIPVAILEAMSCELPVVATDCGGIREAVSDGVEGFVVPTRDAPAAADALRSLHEDAGLRRAMGAAGRARVVADFALDPQLDAFAELYRRLAAGALVNPSPPTPDWDRQSDDAPVTGPKLRVLSAGPLSWRSGHDDAMHAVALLRARGIDCRLRIAGDGPYRDPLLFARRQLGLEAAVELVAAGSAGGTWADVVVDASLDGPRPETGGAGPPVVAVAGDPATLAAELAARVEPAAVA